MAQVTLYLDEETKRRVRKAARAAGVSQSRWLADLVKRGTASEWPAEVRELAGSWPDFPTSEEIRKGEPKDARRENL